MKVMILIKSVSGNHSSTPLYRLVSMSVLMEYLTHSSVSPLPKIFVEVDDPLASSVSDEFGFYFYFFIFLTLKC